MKSSLKNKMEQPKTRGGAREGAGRKPLDQVGIFFKINVEFQSEIDRVRTIPRLTWIKQAMREKLEREKK